MRHRGVFGAIFVVMALLLTACNETGGGDIPVELTEFSISGPASVTTDLDAIEVVNVGEFAHTLVITDSNGEVAAASGLIQPGETTYLDLQLPPGTYSFTCRIVAQDSEGNLIDHYEAGMNTMVEVESQGR